MKKKKVRGIARDTLHFILEASRSSEPNEFAGLLSVEGDIISDVLILPGTESSRMSALVRLYMLPNMSVAGSAHSHPSGDLRPSDPGLRRGRSGGRACRMGRGFASRRAGCARATRLRTIPCAASTCTGAGDLRDAGHVCPPCRRGSLAGSREHGPAP